jgi:hypothetical protein
MYSKTINQLGITQHDSGVIGLLYVMLKALAAYDATGEALTPANRADGILSRLESAVGMTADNSAGLQLVRQMLAGYREAMASGKVR